MIAQSDFSAPERMSGAMLTAILLHGVLLFGLVFVQPEPQQNALPTQLDVTLVAPLQEKTPDKADFLAQANQDSDTANKERPQFQEVATTPDSGANDSDRSGADAPRKRQEKSTKIWLDTPRINEPTPFSWQPVEQASSPEEQAGGQAMLEEQTHDFKVDGTRLRHRQITARTKSFRDAAYMEAWRRKIEAVGNLNFPKLAKGSSGELVLDVGINVDGQIFNLNVIRSSGQQALDQAALDVVLEAAPYTPLPPEIQADTDILHIIYLWRFDEGKVSSTVQHQ